MKLKMRKNHASTGRKRTDIRSSVTLNILPRGQQVSIPNSRKDWDEILYRCEDTPLSLGVY